MEAVFISLMALVVLLTGWVSLIVLWRILKVENGNEPRQSVDKASRV